MQQYVALGLQIVSGAAALAALVISIMSFQRYEKWRKDDKTEITIKQIDEKARSEISALVERHDKRAALVDGALQKLDEKLDGEIGRMRDHVDSADGETRQSLQRIESAMRRELTGTGAQLAKLEEGLKHVPTQHDITRLAEALGRVTTEVAAVGERTAGQGEMLRTIRDFLMERKG